ncbi:MAG: choice-of-anchor B family protein [Candidatus Krumholzibacteria bacterium]|nr:choice-of-anchor B family protein [Candidatus Krumholzibacteria bacterium]MDH4337103.1 choice-of-anchor B family protein [Candidatus Krumholzibacteria bacterium]MDH5268640.1 choice-of-anchor B family protein [Candidatus Krumholzibacteria bacterium]
MRPLILATAIFLLVPASARSTSAVLVGVLDVSPAMHYTDVWGWVDPQTQRCYALIGNNATGLHIVDVTDPAAPYGVSTVNTVGRFDMKTFGSYVYTVDGIGGPGGIVDITVPASPEVVGTFPGGHNIFIDGQGYLYVCLPGLRIYDLNPDPAFPELVWEDPMSDGLDGHDATVIGDVLYEFRGAYGIRFWDVADRTAPVPLGGIDDPTIAYAHNGWPSEDGRYLFVTDEFSYSPSPDITVWNITDPLAPRRVAEIADPTSSVHNCYVVGNLLYVSYYLAGFRLYEITDPSHPVLIDTEDTSPGRSGEGVFEGAWGCYPFTPNGHVYVNDRPNGLYVFRIDGTPSAVGASPSRPPVLDLLGGAPNPFGAETSIRYSLGVAAEVSAAVYDAAGRLVRRLHAGDQPAGEHAVAWDGRSDAGVAVPSGVYFCRVSAAGEERTGRLVLLR